MSANIIVEDQRVAARQAGRVSLRGLLRPTWAALPAAGRVGLAGVVLSAFVAVALGAFIPLEIRRHLLVADGRGLESAVAAITPSMPDLEKGRLDAAQLAHLDWLVHRALLDADHVRAKLWSLDGVVLYSDEATAIGVQYADVVPRLASVARQGVIAEVSDLTDPENVHERQYGRLVEYYVPVRDESGRTVAVFEIYQDVRFFEEALAAITSATWLAIGSGLSVLLIFLLALMAATMRSINRDRAVAEARAEEMAIMVGAADALASSLEPREFLARLDAQVRRALNLSRFGREFEPAVGGTVLSLPLLDGSWLVAERTTSRLTDEDARLLRSVANSLDAALANAALFREVRDAAQARRALLRKVVEAHEDERKHIVGELHDSLAAELIRVLYGVRGIAARQAELPAEIHAEIEALDELVRRAEEDLRAFMARIRPAALDEFGLRAALEDALQRFRNETHLPVELRIRGRPETAPPELQLLLLRATEEGLLNVRKHAAASRVRVTVRVTAHELRLAVDDDGGGERRQDTEEGRGLGLAYLRERVGSFGGVLDFGRSRWGGARLVVELPVKG
jgi:signal transduction histidine kinase